MEIDREMTMEEIEQEFDQEWVLINDPVTDEVLNILSGRVRFHSKSRDEVHEAAMRLGSKRVATEFVGKLPEGIRILL